MPDYDLYIKPNALIAVLKIMGSSATWQEQMRAPAYKRDCNKFYKFHNDHSHQTEDRVSLRYKVVSLLKKGHLRDLLTGKGKQALKKGERNKD